MTEGPRYLMEIVAKGKPRDLNHLCSLLLVNGVIVLLSAAVIRNQLGSLPIALHSLLSKLWATS